MGGIPIATMLSQLTGLPVLFVRKEAKKYGTCKIAEGGQVKGRKLLIVEDVVTSGGAILDAAKALREEGAELAQVVCVIDRESGGPANLAEVGLDLKPLFTMKELKAAGGA
jgi:orotate phosphoribosyltransferase